MSGLVSGLRWLRLNGIGNKYSLVTDCTPHSNNHLGVWGNMIHKPDQTKLNVTVYLHDRFLPLISTAHLLNGLVRRTH